MERRMMMTNKERRRSLWQSKRMFVWNRAIHYSSRKEIADNNANTGSNRKVMHRLRLNYSFIHAEQKKY